MTPDKWIKILNTIKKIKTRDLIVILLVCVVVVIGGIVYKFQEIAPYFFVQKEQDRQVYFKLIKRQKLLNEPIIKILEDVRDDLPAAIKFIAVFKFVPKGEVYQYQGRVLIGFAHRYQQSTEMLIDNFNYGWIPIWSGKLDVEELLNKKAVLVTADLSDIEPQLTLSGNQYTIPSVNLQYLYTLKVDSFYKYPIFFKGRTIAYTVIAFNKAEQDISKQELFSISKLITTKIYGHLIKDLNNE